MTGAELACAGPIFVALCAAIWRFGRLEQAVRDLGRRVSALEAGGCPPHGDSEMA